MKLLVTCEHAGNEIPQELQERNLIPADVVATHRGYDIGAKDLYETLAKIAHFKISNTITRLLVDLNRSTHNKNVFSIYTRKLPLNVQQELLNNYYLPYRSKVIDFIERVRKTGESTLHVSVHTFTQNLNGIERNGDVTLLFDSANAFEKRFAQRWKEQLKNSNPELKVRFNYPYLGKSDGFTTYLRKAFPHSYAGIELEVNQKFATENKLPEWLKTQIEQSLKAAYESW